MVQKRVCTSSDAMVDYQERHLSNGDYHLEEGKVQGEFIGALAVEWGLSEKAILKGDRRFRSFAVLDIATLSGENLKRPRKSERNLRSDRKSTRLNSSHTVISYAVFCLKKKKKQIRDNDHVLVLQLHERMLS